MRTLRTALVLTVATLAAAPAASLHDFTVYGIDGKLQSLAAYRGKVVLVVNVASKCGYTPQYEGLEVLYRKFKDRGLVVLGFPSNDFMWQEPGSNEEIAAFCRRTYGVTFPMFGKVSVRGGAQHPLYTYLTSAQGRVFWNFTKFLVGKDGRAIAKFGTKVQPNDAALEAAIEKALKVE
jgi:glutathione peroxidase